MKVKIYLITNTAVNPYMYYVGLTKFDLDKRLQEHVALGRHEGNKLLSDAIIEYGKRNFTIEVIEEVDESEARTKEDYYIRKYKSHYRDGCGYNMKYETCNYIKHYHGANQEQIQENIENGRPWNYGISFSQQSKEKMKKTKKHRYSLGLYKKFNTNHSQETKDKIAESKRGKKLSQDHKNKISKCSFGRTWIHNKNLKERKFLKKEEISPYLQNGWENGKGVIWMNNGVECMCADVWNYQSFISCGYVNGRIQKLC
jgi:group I intron endonuclease